MANFLETSETFWSFQGEGPLTGRMQVWIRVTGCNFTCGKFGNPNNENTQDVSVIGFNPKDYATLEAMPIIQKGCDTQYSWNRDLFKHVWTRWSLPELAEHLRDLIPFKSFIHPVTNQRVGLTITGGEPGLRLREIAELLHEPALKDLKVVTIETNCSVPIRMSQITQLNEWLAADPERELYWSNSPKMSNSGEKWADAVKPNVAAYQRVVTGREFTGRTQMTQYFKFVSDGSDQSFEEIERAMNEYYAAGIPKDVQVWIMPEGATLEQQSLSDTEIINKAMARGYHVSPRVHIYVYGNAVGT